GRRRGGVVPRNISSVHDGSDQNASQPSVRCRGSVSHRLAAPGKTPVFHLSPYRGRTSQWLSTPGVPSPPGSSPPGAGGVRRVTAVRLGTNPFPGLRAYTPAESELFFGRDEPIDDLLRRLRERRFVAVVGTSGSGKSSLVRAGLVPALERGYLVGASSRW